MSYNIIPTHKFKGEAKRLIKKYPSLKKWTYIVTENKEVYLLTIYDKSELDSIDAKELKRIIAQIIYDPQK